MNLPWAFHIAVQVPFFADLVALSNPRSKFSYLNYKHQCNSLGFRIPAGLKTCLK